MTQYYLECDSTNNFAKEYKYDFSEPLLFLTDYQNLGRGRGTNKWTSPKQGTAFLSTWSIELSASPQPIASPLIGLTLYTSCKENWPELNWSLKAPNDLYISDKKVAGLLIENLNWSKKNRLLIGLGINVLQSPELETSGSLQSFCKKPIEQEVWFSFLDTWNIHLNKVIGKLLLPVLESEDRETLLCALNNNPLLSLPYLEVLPDGGLRTEKRTIAWSEL